MHLSERKKKDIGIIRPMFLRKFELHTSLFNTIGHMEKKLAKFTEFIVLSIDDCHLPLD